MAVLQSYHICPGGNHYTFTYDDGSVVVTTLEEILANGQTPPDQQHLNLTLGSKSEAELKSKLDKAVAGAIDASEPVIIDPGA